MRQPKGIIALPLAFVLVVVALLAVGGSYWYAKSKKQATVTTNTAVVVNTNTTVAANVNVSTNGNVNATTNTNVAVNGNTNTSPDPTAGWKIYTNNEHHFQLQYPDFYKDLSVTTPVTRQKDQYMETSETGVRHLRYRGKTTAKDTVKAEPIASSAYPSLQVNVFSASDYRFNATSGGVEYGYNAVTSKWWQNDAAAGITDVKLGTLENGSVKGYLFNEGDAGHSYKAVAIVNSLNTLIFEIGLAKDPNTKKDLDLVSIFNTFTFLDENASEKFQSAVNSGDFSTVQDSFAKSTAYTLMGSECCGYANSQIIDDLKIRIKGATWSFDQNQQSVKDIKRVYTEYKNDVIGISSDKRVIIYRIQDNKVTLIQFGSSVDLYKYR